MHLAGIGIGAASVPSASGMALPFCGNQGSHDASKASCRGAAGNR